jgi:hypothetical protein
MFGISKKELAAVQARVEQLERELRESKSRVVELEEKLASETSIHDLKVKNLDNEFKDGIGGFFEGLLNLRRDELRNTFDESDRDTADAIRMMDPIRKGFGELANHIPEGHEVTLGGVGPGHAESFGYRRIHGYIFAEPKEKRYKCSCTHSGPPESWETEKLLTTPEEVIKYVAEEIASEIGLEEVLKERPQEGWKSFLGEGEGKQ